MAGWRKYFTLVDASGTMSPINGSENADSRANPSHRNYSSYLPDVYSGHPNRLERYEQYNICLLYTSPSPRDRQKSRMPSSA